MNSEVKTLWVEALRSGRYQQGTGMLNDGKGKFCCLGVLCELAVDAGVVTRMTEPNSEITYGASTNSGAMGIRWSGTLPSEVVEWAEVEAGNPTVDFGGATCTLASVNDGKAQPFTVIADLIEEQL